MPAKSPAAWRSPSFRIHSAAALSSETFQCVLQGSDFDKLQSYGDEFLTKMRASGVFEGARAEPKVDKPQIEVSIDRARAADLGVPVSRIAATLESLFGGRQVTAIQAEQPRVRRDRPDRGCGAPRAIGSRQGLCALGSAAIWSSFPTSSARRNRSRPRNTRISTGCVRSRSRPASRPATPLATAWIISTSIAPDILPEGYNHAWDGETREYVESASDTFQLFALGLLFTFLILAAQFESWIHPITIFTGVALALTGGVLTLYASRFWGHADDQQPLRAVRTDPAHRPDRQERHSHRRVRQPAAARGQNRSSMPSGRRPPCVSARS